MSTPEEDPLATFTVRAAAEPQALPRLIELFALRSLLPRRWAAEVRGSALDVRIEVPGLAPGQAQQLAQRMRQMVLVERVLLEGQGLARSA